MKSKEIKRWNEYLITDNRKLEKQTDMLIHTLRTGIWMKLKSHSKIFM